MKRVLFVDDEPRILQGLQRMLRSQRREWEMVFVESGQAALDACRAQPFDVVVTDMRMPGMDGASLLTQVKAQNPETVRIILSGHTEREAATRAVRVAHQFLMKPSDPDVVRGTVNRACGARALVNDPELRRLLGSIEVLPALPVHRDKLARLLGEPEVQPEEIAPVFARDVGMSAKLLQLVNSSFFGSSREVASVSMAVCLLGVKMLQSLENAGDLFPAPTISADDLMSLQDRAINLARTAASLFPDQIEPREAYSAGLLADIGKMVLAEYLPDRWAEIRRTAGEQNMPHRTAEEQVLGITHSEIGAYLLGLWRLPESLVEAVAHHHAPSNTPNEQLSLLTAVHIAEALVAAAENLSEAQDLDVHYLERLGLSPDLSYWQETASASTFSFE